MPATTRETLEQTPETWRPLLQTAQQWEAQDASNLLESEGIPTVVELESFSGTYFEPFYQKHRLFVPENRVGEATSRLEETTYEKFLINRENSLEGVSDWRYRDLLLLFSGFAIGLLDWIVLYVFHFVDYLRNKLTGLD